MEKRNDRNGRPINVSAIFDCYDLVVLGLAMADNMKAELCVSTVKNACLSFPTIRGAIVHSDYAEENTMPKILNSLDIMRNA